MQAVDDALIKEELDGMRLALWARFLAIAIVIVFTAIAGPASTFNNSLFCLGPRYQICLNQSSVIVL